MEPIEAEVTSPPDYELVAGSMDAGNEIRGNVGDNFCCSEECMPNKGECEKCENECIAYYATIISRCVAHELALEMDARRELKMGSEILLSELDRLGDVVSIEDLQIILHATKQARTILAKHERKD